MRDNIFIALSSKKTAISIAKILVSEGIKVKSAFKNILEMNTTLSYYRGGIIIAGCIFDGVHIDNLMEHIPEGYTVILIGNKEQLDNCDNENVFKLAVPLHRIDLICAIDMLNTIDSGYHPVSNKSSEEEKLVIKAKHTLIDVYSMTEEQAHRYIQKKSMDTGRKQIDIARIILEI